MRLIYLTQNKVAWVDNDIHDIINNFKWCTQKQKNTCYAVRQESRANGKQGKTIRMHHLIAGQPLKGFEVDHIDGNGLNNQRANLRVVTRRVNDQNRTEHRNGNLVGATWNKEKSKWKAQIIVDKKKVFLGYYNTEQEAHEIYKKALEGL